MKTKMPEPVAHFLVDSGSGSFAQVAPEYAVDDDVVGLYGDLQMEAYKDACVREALDALNQQAQELYEAALKARLTRDGAADEDELKAIDLWNVESIGMAKAYTNMQKAIRALIPKQ